MTDELTEQEDEVVHNIWPATAQRTADALGVSVSYVWDIAQHLREKGLNVSKNSDAEYFVPELHLEGDTPAYTAAKRLTAESKSTITRKVQNYLAGLEAELKRELETMDPARADGGLEYNRGGTDLISHYTDTHFGQVIKSEHGDVVIDSEEIARRVYKMHDRSLAVKEMREDAGASFDTSHILLGGDIITNESIYEGQAHEIDENLQEQIDRASSVFMDVIYEHASEFPTVQVVCQAGNHGELRARGSSNHANADDILYGILDKVIRASNLDNVSVVQSDATYYVNFPIREWQGHLRHGHDASLEHIGTSSGKQRWGAWLIEHGFDVAFRGHYHEYKEEPIAGRPVHLGGTVIPTSNFEESRALISRPATAIHGATDEAPTQWTEKVYYE